MIVYQNTKTLKTRNNNNSADCISPNYVYGCLGGCMSSYCYVGRYNKDKVYVNENWDDIYNSVCKWVEDKPFPKVPNQQDPIYYLVDIGCSTDIPLKQKYLKKINKEGLKYILKQYDNHPKLKTTFATKYSHLLTLDVSDFNKKPRVRVSLMPQSYSSILEPNTTKIENRIKDIDRLQRLGWEVHINFSPVIVKDSEKKKYINLFKQIDNIVQNKDNVKCEVIFLTSHKNSLSTSPEINNLMKDSNEIKNSMGVMRYPLSKKKIYTKSFKQLINKYLPWCEIRYIF
jgi:spore photoproduct lyase